MSENPLEHVRGQILDAQHPNVDEINPDEMAEQAFLELDPERSIPLKVRHLAILQLRQMVRKELNRSRKLVKQKMQGKLFTVELQAWYPTKNGNYKLLESLSLEEIVWYVRRQKRELNSKDSRINNLIEYLIVKFPGVDCEQLL